MMNVSLKKTFRQLLCIYESIRNSGTKGLEDEVVILNVRMTNSISLTIALLVLFVGGPIMLSSKSLSIVIPGTVEFIASIGILFLNYKGRYNFASVSIFSLQCIAVLYFSWALGETLQLGSMIIFLIVIIYLITHDKKARNICFAMSGITFFALEILYYLRLNTAIQLSFQQAFVFKLLTNTGILTLMLVVGKRYASSYDVVHKLARANNFIKISIYQIVHELRDNLNVINHVCKRLKAGQDLERQDIDILISACNSMCSIINNVLDFSKIERGLQDEPVVNLIELRSFIRDIVLMQKGEADVKQLVLKVEVLSNVPDFIRSDEGKINQSLTNLIINALKHADEGSSVAVIVKYKEPNLMITVSNSCPDISQDRLGQLFELFYTAKHNSLKEGTGLGLYIVRNKIQSLGGQVNVSSANGITKFSLTFPVIKDTSGVSCEPSTTRIDISGLKILICEDNDMMRLVQEKLLHDHGCGVTSTSNGGDVPFLLRSNSYDVILLDNILPNMTGVEILKYIQNDKSLNDLKVIMITGDSFDSKGDFINSKQEYLALGAAEVLIKPVDPQELLNTINLNTRTRLDKNYSNVV